MGHHIDKNGMFQSDRHPELAPDKIVLSFKDISAQYALRMLAISYSHKDPELSADSSTRLRSRREEHRPKEATWGSTTIDME